MWLPSAALAGDMVIHGGPERVHLVELYTSEGCSSCPPAEAQFTVLKNDPSLWKSVVPVAFHVDYWDNLGWPDRFASRAFTERQWSLARSWGGGSVYTPEFVLDGAELADGDLSKAARPGDEGAGVLTARINPGRELSLTYQAAGAERGWEAHIALLGAGIESEVRAGENGGRRLSHDFVVLWLTTLQGGDGAEPRIKLPPRREGEKAIAVWITRPGGLTPVQAAGGWID